MPLTYKPFNPSNSALWGAGLGGVLGAGAGAATGILAPKGQKARAARRRMLYGLMAGGALGAAGAGYQASNRRKALEAAFEGQAAGNPLAELLYPKQVFQTPGFRDSERAKYVAQDIMRLQTGELTPALRSIADAYKKQLLESRAEPWLSNTDRQTAANRVAALRAAVGAELSREQWEKVNRMHGIGEPWWKAPLTPFRVFKGWLGRALNTASLYPTGANERVAGG